MALRQAATLALVLGVLSGCTRLPWESAEDAFIRCMASNGYQVAEVRIELGEDGSMLEFSEEAAPADHWSIRRASDDCWERVRDAYGAGPPDEAMLTPRSGL